MKGPIIQRTEAALSGWPDALMSGALVAIGVLLIGLAFFMPSRVVKAAALAWVVAP